MAGYQNFKKKVQFYLTKGAKSMFHSVKQQVTV